MRGHHELRSWGQRLLQKSNVQVVLRNGNVDKDGDNTVLNSGRNRRGESGRDSNHLVTGANLTLAKKRRGQRHEGTQVCRGARVDQRAVPDTEIPRKILLKLARVSSRRQPEIQRSVHQNAHLAMVIHARSVGDPVTRVELPGSIVIPLAIGLYRLKYLFSRLALRQPLKHNSSHRRPR